MVDENKRRAFRNSAKITKLLSVVAGEAEAPATYYVLDKLSAKMGLPAPSIGAFMDALRKSGFFAVGTHFNSRGIRTDAPALEMQKILRTITASA